MKLYSLPTPEAPLLSISVPTDGDSDLWSEDYDRDNEPLLPQGPIFDHGYHLDDDGDITGPPYSPLSSFNESEGEGKDQSADEQEENSDLHDMQVYLGEV